MKIDLTKAQGEELDNPYWEVEYQDDDGVTHKAVGIRQLSHKVLIGEPAIVLDENDNIIGYAIEHPDLDDEDGVILPDLLEERQAFTATATDQEKADKLTELAAEAKAAKLEKLDEEAARKVYKESVKTAEMQTKIDKVKSDKEEEDKAK